MVKLFKNRVSIFTKMLSILLCMNGIVFHPRKIFVTLAAAVYYAMLFLCLARLLPCIIHGTDLQDYYLSMLISEILTIIIWWSLFLKKKCLFKLFKHLSDKKLEQKFTVAKILLLSISAILVFPPTYITFTTVHSYWFTVSREEHRSSCRSLWLQKTTFTNAFFFASDTILTYMNYSAFYACFFVFSICGILLLMRLAETEKKIPFTDASTAWMELQYTATALKDMETTLSFPLFLLVAKIAADIFNAVSRIVNGQERSSSATAQLLMSAPQITIWFLSIVGLGDAIRNKSLDVLDASFETFNGARAGVRFGYYDYKKMKAAMNLTLWEMVNINRKLLLTAFTFVLTYGIIIVQFKVSPNSVSDVHTER